MTPWQQVFTFLEDRRALNIARLLQEFIQPEESVLDLGCGPLVAAARIQEVCKARVVGVETLAYRKKPLPLILYGGGDVPVKDRSFDAVVIAFVLHHCDDGGDHALREARRIARRKILLLEDSYDHWLDRIAIHAVDKFLNRLEHPDIPIPYLFRPSWEWKRLFHKMGLRLVATRRMRTTPILKTRQILFVLEPMPDLPVSVPGSTVPVQ